MDEIKELNKSLTAETQSTQREEILPNRETTIGQNLLVLNGDKFLVVAVSRQTKKQFSAPLRWINLTLR